MCPQHLWWTLSAYNSVDTVQSKQLLSGTVPRHPEDLTTMFHSSNLKDLCSRASFHACTEWHYVVVHNRVTFCFDKYLMYWITLSSPVDILAFVLLHVNNDPIQNHANFTPFLNVPIPETHTCISFPGVRYCGGFNPAPTPIHIDEHAFQYISSRSNLPPGVPVIMTLPFCKVVPWERYETI